MRVEIARLVQRFRSTPSIYIIHSDAFFSFLRPSLILSIARIFPSSSSSSSRNAASESVKRRSLSSSSATILIYIYSVQFSEAKDRTPCRCTVQESKNADQKPRLRVMVLPLLKLGTLVLKTLSKPIASRLKKEAGKHPKFRKVIVDMAQANHRLTTTMQRRIYGHATDVEIRPLNEEKAVQSAVDLLGEFFVFSVAGVALILEVQRSARSEAKKEELRKKDLEGMRQKEEELAKEIELLKKKLEELEQLARGQGLAGVFNIRHPRAEDGKSGKLA